MTIRDKDKTCIIEHHLSWAVHSAGLVADDLSVEYKRLLYPLWYWEHCYMVWKLGWPCSIVYWLIATVFKVAALG